MKICGTKLRVKRCPVVENGCLLKNNCVEGGGLLIAKAIKKGIIA
jgi:hypothetical protein